MPIRILIADDHAVEDLRLDYKEVLYRDGQEHCTTR